MQLHYSLVGRSPVAAKILLLFAIVMFLAPSSRAQSQKSHEAEFRAFYAGFLTAVGANDKDKLADLIAFPVKDWSVERKGNVETVSIKDKAEFLAKYDSLFTPFMRTHVLKAKPQKITDAHYTVIWRDANAEFSFEFQHVVGNGYRVFAYGIGPL